MNDDTNIEDLDANKFASLDGDSQDDVIEELAERFLDDPDDAIAQAEDLDVDMEDILDNL